MQTAVVGVTEPREHHPALVRAPIIVGVFERDHIRRVGHEERPVAPNQAHREDQFVGEHARHLEATVAILVLEPFHPAQSRPGGDFSIQIEPGRLRYEQTPAVIERGEHGEHHLILARDLFDDKILRCLKRRGGKRRRRSDRRGRRGCDGGTDQRPSEPVDHHLGKFRTEEGSPSLQGR